MSDSAPVKLDELDISLQITESADLPQKTSAKPDAREFPKKDVSLKDKVWRIL